jgi:hypothetical protein
VGLSFQVHHTFSFLKTYHNLRVDKKPPSFTFEKYISYFWS